MTDNLIHWMRSADYTSCGLHTSEVRGADGVLNAYNLLSYADRVDCLLCKQGVARLKGMKARKVAPPGARGIGRQS